MGITLKGKSIISHDFVIMGLIFKRDKFDLSKQLVHYKRPKIEKNTPPECYSAYDAFLRSQVFNEVDSNLVKNLDSEKRAEIENFKDFTKLNKIELQLQQKRTAFLDAIRQQQSMQNILKDDNLDEQQSSQEEEVCGSYILSDTTQHTTPTDEPLVP